MMERAMSDHWATRDRQRWRVFLVAVALIVLVPTAIHLLIYASVEIATSSFAEVLFGVSPLIWGLAIGAIAGLGLSLVRVHDERGALGPVFAFYVLVFLLIWLLYFGLVRGNWTYGVMPSVLLWAFVARPLIIFLFYRHLRRSIRTGA
jgi:hypothetical protein